jgi:RNA polymerase sigma-70 factor (ECF subfamily)
VTETERLTDAELMRLVREGSQDAFAELVRRYQDPLLNFFRRMGAPTDGAEDLVQETFLRVFGYRRKWRPTGKFTSFLYVLARHAWADRGRRLARWPSTDTDAVARAASSGKDASERAAARMDVDEALGGLSEKLRLVVVMSVCQGMEYREIAEALKIPIGTVKSRMHLAMGRLKEMLGEGE